MPRQDFTGKVLGAGLIKLKLTKLSKVTRAKLPHGMNMISADLLQRSADLAPILSGDLIRSGDVKSEDRGGVFKRLVTYGTDHAIFTHEGEYNLGPISSQKPPSSDGPIGRKYLVRPFDIHRRRYAEFIKEIPLHEIRRL